MTPHIVKGIPSWEKILLAAWCEGKAKVVLTHVVPVPTVPVLVSVIIVAAAPGIQQ